MTLPPLFEGSGRGDRLRRGREPSRAREEAPRLEELRRWLPARGHLGHGTFVAGIIAAGVGNGIGIAGLAPSAELLVAKVVTPSREIPIEAEAKAIRWAVENGARVINLSLGGIRDPLDPDRDSLLAARGRRGRVRGIERRRRGRGRRERRQRALEPWPYASYPAALPHVLGVSAVNEAGGVPKFSNRDQVYNDLAAPGDRILSILPAAAHVALSRLCGAGVLELRSRGVPRGAGHLLRRAAGDRRRCAAARPAADTCAPSR